MLDLKIVHGRVYDGTGQRAVLADVGVKGDRIEALGDLSNAESKETVEAAGKAVCPGFIDAHSHSDAYLIIEPSAPSKLHQGITTEVVGNCGGSAAPIAGAFKMPSDWRDKSYPKPWATMAEYRKCLEEAKPAPNVFVLTGHRNLRVAVAGYESRVLTDDEIRQMGRMLDQTMDEGSRGLSSGLLYAPSGAATLHELVEVAKVAARRHGIYTTHMRSEGARLIEAIEEALAVGREAGIRLQISHLKTAGRKNWSLVDRAVELVRTARERGQEVMADRYPYTSACTELDIIFPGWATEGGVLPTLRRLADPAERKRMRDGLKEGRAEEYWGTIVIGSTSHPDNARFRGMPLPEVAAILGMEPAEAVLHLAETDQLKTSAFFAGMSEENMLKILAEPYVILGSDASLRAPSGPVSDYPHPRAYGSFPKFLRMALDGKTVQVEEAIRKMTSMTADQFRMKDRGVLARGKKADIVVFDPDRVRDKATYANPHQFAEGVEQVVVNGVLTLDRGRFTGKRAGQIL